MYRLDCLNETGGMGKSTLADQVYREMSAMTLFNGATKYVRFDIDSQGLDHAVLRELHEWLRYRNGPVLLYLDNIQTKYQLDSLLPNGLLKANSFVLITSRNRGLVPAFDTYEMPIMEYEDAVTLFRLHSNSSGNAQPSQNPNIQVTCMLLNWILLATRHSPRYVYTAYLRH
jgi:hypothetical protein